MGRAAAFPAHLSLSRLEAEAARLTTKDYGGRDRGRGTVRDCGDGRTAADLRERDRAASAVTVRHVLRRTWDPLGVLLAGSKTRPPLTCGAASDRRSARCVGTMRAATAGIGEVIHAMESHAGPPGPDWGLGHYERTAETLLPAARVLVDAAALRRDERVVDVGCGTGNVALLAASAGARTTAVDPSPRLLDVTRAAARDNGLEITCELGEAAALPLQKHSVDCLLSNFGLVFAPIAAAAVAEVARVLDARGRALFTAWLPGGAIGALAATAQELVEAALGVPPASRFAWHDPSAVSALFTRHGMAATVKSRHDLVFAGTSPEAFLEAEHASHPLAVAGFRVLEQHGTADKAYRRLLKVLLEHNEDPASFRSTSHYVVVEARPA